MASAVVGFVLRKSYLHEAWVLRSGVALLMIGLAVGFSVAASPARADASAWRVTGFELTYVHHSVVANDNCNPGEVQREEEDARAQLSGWRPIGAVSYWSRSAAVFTGVGPTTNDSFAGETTATRHGVLVTTVCGSGAQEVVNCGGRAKQRTGRMTLGTVALLPAGAGKRTRVAWVVQTTNMGEDACATRLPVSLPNGVVWTSVPTSAFYAPTTTLTVNRSWTSTQDRYGRARPYGTVTVSGRLTLRRYVARNVQCDPDAPGHHRDPHFICNMRRG